MTTNGLTLECRCCWWLRNWVWLTMSFASICACVLFMWVFMTAQFYVYNYEWMNRTMDRTMNRTIPTHHLIKIISNDHSRRMSSSWIAPNWIQSVLVFEQVGVLKIDQRNEPEYQNEADLHLVSEWKEVSLLQVDIHRSDRADQGKVDYLISPWSLLEQNRQGRR